MADLCQNRQLFHAIIIPSKVDTTMVVFRRNFCTSGRIWDTLVTFFNSTKICQKTTISTIVVFSRNFVQVVMVIIGRWTY